MWLVPSDLPWFSWGKWHSLIWFSTIRVSVVDCAQNQLPTDNEFYKIWRIHSTRHFLLMFLCCPKCFTYPSGLFYFLHDSFIFFLTALCHRINWSTWHVPSGSSPLQTCHIMIMCTIHRGEWEHWNRDSTHISTISLLFPKDRVHYFHTSYPATG